MNKKILQLLSLAIVGMLAASCSNEDELTNLITDAAYTPVSVTVAKGSPGGNVNVAANGPQRIEYHYDEAQSNPLWATWEQEDVLYVCYNNNVNKLTMSSIDNNDKKTATFTGLIKGKLNGGETLKCVAGDRNQSEIITVNGDGTFEYKGSPFLNQDATVGGAGKLNVYTCTNAKYNDGKIINNDNSSIVPLSPSVAVVKFEVKYPLGIDNNENATLTYKSKSGETETEIAKVIYTTKVNNEKAQDIFIAFPAQAFSGTQTLVLNIGDKKYSKTLSSGGVSLNQGYVYRKEINFAPDNNNHPYVDLCLPSGNLWAKVNIGADKETDYGDYFQWGEIEPVKDDTYVAKSTYKWTGTTSKLLKYNGDDKLIFLEREDDAANVNWGGDWVIPTEEDFVELFNNTTREYCEIDGVKGLKLTSKCTGSNEYIFLPAAGYRQYKDLLQTGTWGYYNSSELSQSPTIGSASNVNGWSHWYITFNYDQNKHWYNGSYRGTYAISVRPMIKFNQYIQQKPR